jgi:hypothetical protein
MGSFNFTYKGKVYPLDYRVERYTDGKHEIQKFTTNYRGRRIVTGNFRQLIDKLGIIIESELQSRR